MLLYTFFLSFRLASMTKAQHSLASSSLSSLPARNEGSARTWVVVEATMLRKASARRLRKCRTVPADSHSSARRSHFRKFFPSRRGKSLTRLDTREWDDDSAKDSQRRGRSRRRHDDQEEPSTSRVLRDAVSEIAPPPPNHEPSPLTHHPILRDPDSLDTDIFL